MTKFALIIANPNSDELGEIVSTHRTREAAERALHKLAYARWAYVAERKSDGSWPCRVEAQL